MTDDQISYLMIRAVRAETGASHEECRRLLEETGGDVAAAAALWFARKRDGAGVTASRSSPERHRDNDRERK